MSNFGRKLSIMRTIAIVAGGDSSEFEISVKSAHQVSNILSARYNSYVVMIRGSEWYWEDSKGMFHNVDKNDFSLKLYDQKVRFDGVFVAIHGTPGENGLLQGYFDMIGIPYTSCNAFTSALTFNKQACKLFLKEYGIEMAQAVLIRKGDVFDPSVITAQTGLPCFVKPNDSGSSFGVTKVKKKEDLLSAIEFAFRESDEVLIEAFLNGREVACGILKTKDKLLVLPVTEIISKNEFFDYEAKYTPGRSDEITPAQLPCNTSEEVQRLSLRIYELLGCSGIVRVDFIIVGNKPYFLEINTVPGLTKESIVPKQAAAYGITLEEFFSMSIEDMF
ncbi:MAG TPA: D-alanine--D-alanine ligase [Bacteroidales bacterium]|nr:D-alanine--D-alanine ligase [Bacteroidales bacterium]